ncbi:MAG: MFS transporter [Chloroflexi bacterium]|nr:MAG: MFS transporter [Chloroflexota bacterium]
MSFTEPRERATAFAVYGSIAGSGAAIGLLLGGMLTEYLSWRWCLYVNVPIAIIAAIGGAAVLPASSPASGSKFDVPGVVLATGGLVALVYASTAAVTNGWSSPAVEALFGAAIAAFALFVWRETRTPSPLLPLRIVADRNRGGAYLTVTLVIAGMFGAFLFLTYYFQVVLHYTPFQAGLAFLPLVVAQQAGSWLIASRLMPLVPPRALMAPGAIVAAAGMAFLTQVPLVAEVLLGLGVSCVMVPAFSTATQRVDRREAGVASATASAASQIGGSLGAALLNAIAVSSGGTVAHGFMVATGWGAGILVLAAAASGSLINAGRPGRRQAA